jgi:hypothetical protein
MTADATTTPEPRRRTPGITCESATPRISIRCDPGASGAGDEQPSTDTPRPRVVPTTTADISRATRRGAGIALAALWIAGLSCGPAGTIAAGADRPLPPHREVAVDTTPKARPRMMPPEVYLRAYLTWFGGLAPLEVQARARGRQLFDAWDDYLAALGLPDYRLDLPRQTQTNTLMLAAFGRLGEALCVRAAEHDLRGPGGKRPPLSERVVFAFEPVARPSAAQFAERFDVLHRGFLGYPAALAPAERTERYHALFSQVAAHHAAKAPLSPEETAWAAVCAALIQHPETGLY